MREGVKKIYDSGVKFGVGADCFHYSHSLAHELEILVACGVSEMDALLAVTRQGAELCGVASKLGTLEVGKIADIIAVERNPLTDITALKEVRLVMKDGKIYNL